LEPFKDSTFTDVNAKETTTRILEMWREHAEQVLLLLQEYTKNPDDKRFIQYTRRLERIDILLNMYSGNRYEYLFK